MLLNIQHCVQHVRRIQPAHDCLTSYAGTGHTKKCSIWPGYDKFLSTGEFFPNTQFMCCIFLFGHANSSIKHPVMGGELVDSRLWEGTAIAVPWELEVMVDGVVDRLELCSFYYLGMVGGQATAEPWSTHPWCPSRVSRLLWKWGD